MRPAPAYEGAASPDPVVSHLSATVDRAARWRRAAFRASLAGTCVLLAILAAMILADTAYGGWIEDLTGLSISGIVNNFFTALGLGDGVAAIMQSASDTWLSQLASYKFNVDASRVAVVIAVINKAAAPVGESLIMVFLFQGVFKKVTATDGSFFRGDGLYELVMMLVKFFLYKTLIDLAPLIIYGILLAGDGISDAISQYASGGSAGISFNQAELSAAVNAALGQTAGDAAGNGGITGALGSYIGGLLLLYLGALFFWVMSMIVSFAGEAVILARFVEVSVLTGFCSIPVAFLISEEWSEAGRMYFKEIGSAAIMVAVVQAVVIIAPMVLEGVIVTSGGDIWQIIRGGLIYTATLLVCVLGSTMMTYKVVGKMM